MTRASFTEAHNTPKFSTAVQRRIEEKLVERLFKNNTTGIFISLLFSYMVAYFLLPISNTAFLLGWVIMMTLVCLSRLALVVAYSKNQNHDPVIWKRYFIIGTTMMGISWGSAILLLFPAEVSLQQTMLLVVVIGLVAGAIPFLSAQHTAYMSYAVPAVFLSAIKMFSLGGDYLYLVFFAIPYLAVLISSSKEFYQSLYDSYGLLEANAELLEEKQNAVLHAQSADQAKSRFLSAVSHEVRTPLNAILGLTESVLKNTQDAGLRHKMSVIKASGDSLLSTVNTILDFSKIEAGQMEYQPESVNIRAILDKEASLYSALANDKRLEICLDIDPQLPDLLVTDGQKVEQILNNLISNAIKFTASGIIQIQCRLIQQQQPPWLELNVIDSGCGIEAQQLDNIFLPFVQIREQSHLASQGTGLGLAISAQMAKIMGGSLAATSQPAQGSCFSLSVPVAIKSLPESKPTPADKQLLLIDSHCELSSMYSNQLTYLGYQHNVVASPAQINTTDKQTGQTYDLAIYVVHAQDSFEQDIQELLANTPQQPILALTPAFLLKQLPTVVNSTRITWREVCYHADLLDKHIRELTTLECPSESLPVNSENNLIKEQLNAKVLLVEDSEFNQEVALVMFENLSCNIDIACDGIEAIKQAKQQSYDIIFMDINLPRLSGVDACQQIRQLSDHYAKTPIIALTADAIPAHQKSFIEQGLSDCLTKPYRFKELRDICQKWVPEKIES